MKQIVIVTPIPPMYSETFIHMHMKRLPFAIHHFHSLPKMGYHPIIDGSGKTLTIDFKPLFYLETLIDVITGHRGIGYSLRKKNMRRYFNKNNIEAVLAEYGPAGAHLADVCEQTGIPLIVHYHGRDAYHYKTLKRYESRYRRMFEIASAIVVVSNDMRNQLLQLGCPEDKIELNPYGPDESVFQPIQALTTEPVFLSVGRFTAKKAPISTLEAFSITLKSVPEAKLIMAGDGELLEACKEYVQSKGITDRVTFTGPVNPVVISGLHRLARIFIQHSIRAEDGDSEGTPVAILEAMASGLPVVSTRHAGIMDAVAEGVTGYLVDEGDIEGMANYMTQLILDYNQCIAMGVSAVDRLQNNYTLDRHIDQLTGIINRSIDQSKTN